MYNIVEVVVGIVLTLAGSVGGDVQLKYLVNQGAMFLMQHFTCNVGSILTYITQD